MQCLVYVATCNIAVLSLFGSPVRPGPEITLAMGIHDRLAEARSAVLHATCRACEPAAEQADDGR